MTPETRAARDRITAFLDQRGPELHDRIAYSDSSRDAAVLFASDLRVVLAALDPQPVGIIHWDGPDLTEEQVEEVKRRFLGFVVQHDGRVVRLPGNPRRAPCAECGRPIQYIDHPGLPNGWMHILEAHNHDARPATPKDPA